MSFLFISFALWRRMEDRPALFPMLCLGFGGGVFGLLSFSGIMLATRIDRVGEAAVLRETSTVFAAIIGWLVLREEVHPVHAAMMVAIAAGPLLVEFGR